jgi:hypothetical protein
LDWESVGGTLGEVVAEGAMFMIEREMAYEIAGLIVHRNISKKRVNEETE